MNERTVTCHVKRAPLWWLLCGLLFVAILGLYAQTRFFDFINLDDWKYVKECEWLRDGFTWPTIYKAFTEYRDTGCWFPLTRLSYVWDVSVFGLCPAAMHLHNVLLHAANAVLVFILLCRVLEKKETQNSRRVAERLRSSDCVFSAAAVAALIWAVHPLRVESVAWIAGRKDVLSLFWELLALIFWMGGFENSEIETASGDNMQRALRISGSFYWQLAIACFVFACLAKPMAITFVFLVGWLDLFVFGRLRWARLWVIVVLTLPLIALSIYTQKAVGNLNDPLALPFIGRILNAISALGIYIKQTVWPEALRTPCLPCWPRLPELFWQSLLGLCAIGGIVAYHVAGFFRKQNDVGTWTEKMSIGYQSTVASEFLAWSVLGIGGYLLSVMPTVGVVAFGYQAHADRFTYLPAVWLSIPIAGGLTLLQQRSGRQFPNLVVLCLCIGGLVVLSTLSYRQTKFWRNTETLSRRALEFEPDNVVAHKNLGTYLFVERRRLKEACQHIKQASEHYPDPIWYILGITIMIDSGEMEEAKAMTLRFLETIKQKEADGWNIHYKIAYAYYAYCTGEINLAREHFAFIADKNPTFAPVQYMLGRLAQERGETEEKRKAWSIAARDPLFNGWLK